jgi:hypothetical protein
MVLIKNGAVLVKNSVVLVTFDRFSKVRFAGMRCEDFSGTDFADG